jgi:hypothetical protein
MSDRHAAPDVLPGTCRVLVAIVGEKQRDHLKLPCLRPVRSRNYLYAYSLRWRFACLGPALSGEAF